MGGYRLAGGVAGSSKSACRPHSGASWLPRCASALLAGAVALVLAGCSGPLTQSAITSNLVQEDAHNAYLMLNIARAHERMPMHFTQVNAVRAAPGGLGIGTPGLTMDIPFGGAAAPSYALHPTLDAAPAVDTISLVSQEFMRGLTTPVDARLMAYFASQGWPLPILLYMFVGAVETYDSQGNLLHSLVNSPRNETFPVFRALIDVVAGCRLVLSESASYEFYGEKFAAGKMADVATIASAKAAGLVPVEVGEDGKELSEPARGTRRYYRLAHVVREAGVKLDASGAGASGHAGASDCAIDATAPAAPGAELTAEAQASVEDTIKRIGKALSTLSISVSGPGDKLQKPAKKTNGAAPRYAEPEIAEARLVLRSTQSMIYYLGELSRYQNAETSSRIAPVTVRIGRERKAHLFRMRCCDAQPDAAVAVAWRDKHFSIGRYVETTGDAPEDRSVQTLALLSLVYTLQNRSAEPPAISNVRVLNR